MHCLRYCFSHIKHTTNFEFIFSISFKTILFFHAVYRDCIVYLNGKEVAKHFNSGYTPFRADITNDLKVGKNLLLIECSNAYSKTA